MIMATLRDLNDAGRTIVMVTHNEMLASYADRIVKILDGKIIGEEMLGGAD